MSIETNLASIAKSLETLVTHLTADKQPAAATTPAVVPVPTVAATPAAPAVEVPAVPAFAMPIPPAATPAAPVSTQSAPFADGKGLMDYIMSKYRALGPVKGGMIQNVLSEIGCKNINEVQPAHYAAFYAKVEAIQ